MMTLRMETVSNRLTLTSCPACSIQFAVPEDWEAARRETGDGFWCPNGHTLSFKSLIDRLRRDLAQEKTRRLAAEDQATAASRSAAALRGEVTKMRKRAAAGVCPCCHRTFAQLARHMKSRHPGFGDDSA